MTGAAWGAGSGAVSGAVRGDAAHAAKQQEIDGAITGLKKEIGEDAYAGVAALTDGKRDVALAYARTAQKDANEDHAEAGSWLEALTYADLGNKSEVERLLPALAAVDPDLADANVAKGILRELETSLAEIRQEFGISVD